MAVKTDLHTHFAGILPPDDLIHLAVEHNLVLDAPTAKKLGVADSALRVADMSNTQIASLKKGLDLQDGKQYLFDDLDKVYANRAFITKDPHMFAPLLESIARAYAHQGVIYAELSYAGIITNPDLVRVMHEHLPRIEAETGVKLRFLGALWRHSDADWNMDETDRLREILKSPYVVGIDVMGHEKNPIRYLSEQLKAAVSYAVGNIPGFVVRIHAGENPYYSAEPSTIDDYSFNNTYEAIDIVDKARRNTAGDIEAEHGAGVQIRVGHGRYGLHTDTLKLMKKIGVIAELCLSSNWKLNHTEGFQGPFNTYREESVYFVLGSDGFGMYGTSLPREMDIAMKAGMTERAKDSLAYAESKILENDATRFAIKTTEWDKLAAHCAQESKNPFARMRNPVFTTPDGKPRWNQETAKRKEAEILQQCEDLKQGLAALGVETEQSRVQELLAKKEVLLFSGASKTSWKRVPEDQQQHIEKEMSLLIDTVDPKKDAVMTGGTDFGFEAVIHRLVEARNKKLPEGEKISVVGAVTLEANLKDIRAGTLSHVAVLSYGSGFAMSWMDQPAALLDMFTALKGHCIMVGGGQVISDMIVDGDGRGLIAANRIHLMRGINGASGDKADKYPNASFGTTAELITKIKPEVIQPQSHIATMMSAARTL